MIGQGGDYLVNYENKRSMKDYQGLWCSVVRIDN